MEEKREREWKTILCPGRRERYSVMCEWEILSEKGRILKRDLKQIDCSNPELAALGGADCDWSCEAAITKRQG
ncbi:MAG: hypothetical protein HXY46_09480 [Syntrophaceae bacterium]|nr:hypothetical protein [Syntrophaceae bacterium]